MILEKFLMLLGCVAATLLAAPTDDAVDSAQATASVDRSAVQIADPFELKVKIIAPRATKVSFPEFGDHIGPFDILEFEDDHQGAVDSASSLTTFTRTYLLETLDTGDLELPSIEVSTQDEGGDSRLLRTAPIKVSVTSLVEANADLTKFNDLAGLIDVDEPPPTNGNVVWISVVAGLAVAAAAGCLACARRSPVHTSAGEWALGRLNEAEGDFTKLEGILREFVEERFDFPAASLGAAALMGELAERAVDEQAVAKIEEIVATSQRVKFGGSSISQSQSARLFQQTRELITSLGDKEAV